MFTMIAITTLPKNAYTIIEYIQVHGPQTQKTLNDQFDITLRALRYALDKLEKARILIKRPNLKDMRSPFYVLRINGEELEQIKCDNLSVSPLSVVISQEVAAST